MFDKAVRVMRILEYPDVLLACGKRVECWSGRWLLSVFFPLEFWQLPGAVQRKGLLQPRDEDSKT